MSNLWRSMLGVLSLALAGAAGAAPFNPGDIDYVIPTAKQATATRIEFPGTPCAPCWGHTVRYTTFSTPVQTFDAARYDGQWITLLIPLVHPRSAEVTPDRVRVLVDRLDLLYAAYRELLGWEPAKAADPLGKQVFAVVPNEPANFYGLAFVPGDSSEYSNAVLGERALDDDLLSNVWVHELAHNFDPIHLWDYGPDPAHDWTTLIQVWFARRQARMDEVGRQSWAEFEDYYLSLFSTFRAGVVTWQQCAATVPRPQACSDANASLLSGLFEVEIAKHLDGAAMRDWIRKAYADQQSGLTLGDASQRSDYRLNSLAEITRTDTRCVASHFRWNQGGGLGAAAQFPTPFPGCLDSDSDGYKRFDDCDDTSAATRPGASEVADGRDNDCDRVVDDIEVVEASLAGGDFSDNLWDGTPLAAYPVSLRGEFATRAVGSAPDRDAVRLPAPVSTLLLRVCATGTRVLVVGLATNGVGYGPIAAASPGGCGTNVIRDNTWVSVSVQRENETLAGGYTLDVYSATTMPAWPRPPAVKLARTADGLVRASIDAAQVPGGLAGTELRWLQSGAGWVRQGAASDPAQSQAPVPTPAALSAARPVQLRAQLWRGGMPIEEPSNPYLLDGSASLPGVIPDSSYSGTWYSPLHDGEGFMLEMLPAGRFIAYWFTYDPSAAVSGPVGSAAQHWLLADGQQDGRALRAPLLRVSGGRYGRAMNPAELVITTVGEIEFSFSSDTRGAVHYRVDGRTGEFALERLTRFASGSGARGLSGSWYQPSLRGQGLVVQETTRNELIAIMFTFDQQRRPAWAVLQGTIGSDGSIGFGAAPFRASGGLFGRGYRPASLTPQVQGSASLSLNCTGGSFAVTLPAIDPAAQSFALERIAMPAGIACP